MIRSTYPTAVRAVLLVLAAALLLAGAPAAQAAPPRPPRATPAPVSDPVPALSACASDIFGLSLSYSESGGLSAEVARSLSIPNPAKEVVSATLSASGTAIYGKTSGGGLETLAYGKGAGSGGDVSVAVSKASLCYLQLPSTQPKPTSAEAALSLLKATFPGVPQRSAYSARSSAGGYVFTLKTTHPVKGSNETTAQGLMLVAYSSQGKLVLGALSGTGTYAASIPAK